MADGISLTAAWYHTNEGRLWALRDVGISPADFTRFDIANPLGNSEMIPIYDLVPGTDIGNILVTSSDIDKRAYHGIELSMQARLASGGTIIGGWYFDRQIETRCDTTNPNGFRFCDEAGALYQDHGAVEPIPFRHEFKFALTHALPWDFEGAVSFISYPGTGTSQRNPVGGQDRRWRDIVYLVPNSAFPAGAPTAAAAVPDILLIGPGTSYLDRWNQLDISIKRRFRAGHLDILPSLDLYNVNNSSVVLGEVETLGAIGRPTTLLGGRLMRLGVLIRF